LAPVLRLEVLEDRAHENAEVVVFFLLAWDSLAQVDKQFIPESVKFILRGIMCIDNLRLAHIRHVIFMEDYVLKIHWVIHWVMSHSRLLNSLGEEGLWLEHKDPSRPEKTPKLHPEVILLHILGKSEESPISLALDGQLDWTQAVKTLGALELEQGLQEFEVFCFIFKKRGLLKSFNLEVEDIKGFMNEVEVVSWKRTLNHLLKSMEDDLFV